MTVGNFVEDDLADYLTTSGGGGLTTTIYRGFMPESPDEALQIVVTGGYSDVHAFGRVVEERPAVQMVRRSPVANRARAELQYIKQFLSGSGDVTLNGTRYSWFSALHPPFLLERDTANRWKFALNFTVAKAPTTSTST